MKGVRTEAERRGQLGLIIAILLPNSDDLRHQIKHLGDVKIGVPTQCLVGFQCCSIDFQI